MTRRASTLRALVWVVLVGVVLVPCLCQSSAGGGGYIVSWGSGVYGLPPEVTNGSNVARVSAGRSHVLVLLTSGELRAYGTNTWGQISIPAAARADVADISAGLDHSLVVLKNGTVYGFGWDEYNQSTIPAALKGVKVKQVAAGFKHSLALTEAGVVVGWGGSEEWGQATVPAELDGQNVTAIAAGSWTSIAVLDGGKSLVQWGSHSPPPPNVQQQGVAPGPLSVAIGLDHVTALLPDGSVSVWPAATAAPAFKDALSALVQVPAAASSNVVAISAKTNVSMALLASGKVLVWGLPDDSTYLQVPQQAQSGVTGISAGDNFGTAIHAPAPPAPPSPPSPPTPPRAPLPAPGSGGYITAWGDSKPYGLLPEVTAGKSVARVSAGNSHILVLLTNGQLRAYGSNAYGQITIPPAAKANISDISAGYDHSLVVTASGAVYAFGDNSYNQSAVPKSLQGVKVKQVAGGLRHSLALTVDGKVVAWGDGSDFGQTDVPAELQGRNVTAIAAGSWTSVAVLDGGKSVVQWGSVSPLPPEVERQGVMPGRDSVAIGLDHITALLADGSVTVWPAATIAPAYPDALAKVMQVPARAASNVIAVSAQENISMALLSTGEPLVWGGAYDPSVLQVPFAAKAGAIGIAAGVGFAVAVEAPGVVVPPSPPGPAVTTSPPVTVTSPPAPGATTATNISFTLSLLASSTLASNTTQQAAFSSQLQAAIASFFGVDPSQVQLQVTGVAASRRRLLQAPGTSGGTRIQVAVQVAASWLTSDTATPARLKQQLAALNQDPTSMLPAAVQQQLGVSGMQLQAPATATPGTLGDVGAPSPAPGPSPGDGGGGGGKVGIIVGVVVGAVALLAAIVGGAFWWRRKRRAQPPAGGTSRSIAVPTFPEGDKHWAGPDTYNTHSNSDAPPLSPGQAFFVAPYTTMAGTQHTQQALSHSSLSGAASGGVPPTPGPRLQPSGIVAGDPFLHTATQLTWTEYTPGPQTVRVEAGINDTQLDAQATGGDCPVVELSNTEVRQQLEILTDGLIGKGGAALVFTARWPSRFGPDALLAVKLLKNAYDASPSILQTFAYEAKLLATIKHDHVVRLYGYCMELPTVCLIMELLPGSLEDVLYNSGPARTKLSSWQSTAFKHALATPPGPGTPALSTGGTGHGGSKATTGGGTASGPTSSTNVTGDVALALAAGQAASGTLLQPQPTIAPSSRMSMLQVLQVCVDVAAGLDYLHNRQLSSVAAALAPSMSTCSTGMRDSVFEDTHASLQAQLSESLSAKVAHRDLKPANILLNSRGGAKLSDFGLARENPTTTVHTVHVGAGTLHYMAPELLASRGPGVLPTNRVDIYSLGIMMWEMVAGKKPWSGHNPMQLQLAVAAKKRPIIPDKDKDDSASASDLAATPAGFYAMPGFVDLIRACWRQRDHKRPPASEVHARLVAMLNLATGKAAAGTSWPADKADKDDDE